MKKEHSDLAMISQKRVATGCDLQADCKPCITISFEFSQCTYEDCLFQLRAGAGVSCASRDDTIVLLGFFLSVWASQTLGMEHITSLIVIQVTFPQVISTLKLSRLKIGDCTNELC